MRSLLSGSLSSLGLLLVLAAPARADVINSYTGSLTASDDSSTGVFTVSLAGAGTLDLQTWGFGGGTNAAGHAIAAGGFDPFLGVFAGTGAGAAFIDGTSDILSNYSSHMGCPPAGTVNIGGATCGDVHLSMSLAAGTYTVLLTDGAYLPNAVFETNGLFGDGFTDFSAGAFQTCNGATCVNDTANWALDIGISGQSTGVPEPAAIALLAGGLAGVGLIRRRSNLFRQA